MKNKNKKVDPIPEEFRTEEEAGKFWDEHSVADYEEFLEPIKCKIEIKKRYYEIEIDEDSFAALRRKARKQHKPMKQLANEIIRQGLSG